jgi:basic membrane protein A
VKAGKFKAEDYGHLSTMKFKGSDAEPAGHVRRQGAQGRAGQGACAKEKAILAGKFTVKVDDGQPKGSAK